MTMARRPILLAALAVVVVAAVVAGLSQAPTADTDPKPTNFTLAQAQKELAGAPAPLAALHAQAGELLGGGKDAIRARIASFKGTPVVVNKWASWCGPCRAEFPYLQQASVDHGKEVAFIGLNSGDNAQDASAFLRKFPVPYPSYEDPKEKIAIDLKASTAYPITIFYDATGKQVYLHQGYYAEQKQLDEDLAKYLKIGT